MGVNKIKAQARRDFPIYAACGPSQPSNKTRGLWRYDEQSPAWPLPCTASSGGKTARTASRRSYFGNYWQAFSALFNVRTQIWRTSSNVWNQTFLTQSLICICNNRFFSFITNGQEINKYWLMKRTNNLMLWWRIYRHNHLETIEYYFTWFKRIEHSKHLLEVALTWKWKFTLLRLYDFKIDVS